MRSLELLAPAKNLECGIAAVNHGADAVYIGAAQFGARVSVGNSVEDIGKLCDYAHKFGAKVYVTVNTIIYDNELESAFKLIDELADAGADALLVQDMAIVVHGVGLPLHASTQTDNRSADKVAWLKSLGFDRVVLARELSLNEIAAIHNAVPDVELECFVHGSICVSYSGVCYASLHCFNRSANRGECAQFCRMKYDLIDADDNEIERGRYLLSMKDMCRIDELEQLAKAGVCSFKIEGRLKDINYVKNVVAAYSQQLNNIVAANSSLYCRASCGRVKYSFKPNLNKTFNRDFTNYFLHGRKSNIASFDTPKAIGEFVGNVKEIRRDSFTVAGTAAFANGDGLCFVNDERELEGFRVNRAEGNRLFPFNMPVNIKHGMALYRNNDEAFERILSRQTAVRKIPVEMVFDVTPEGFSLTIDGNSYAELKLEKQFAQKPQRDNIIRQLTKLGDTVYVCDYVQILNNADKYFIPSSLLAQLRRDAMAKITCNYNSRDVADYVSSSKNIEIINTNKVKYWQPEYKKYPYLYNVSNHLACEFYEKQELKDVENSFETRSEKPDESLIMQCKHCIKYAFGYCEKYGGKHTTWQEPLYLRAINGTKFRLQFDCAACKMNVYGEE